MRRLFNEMALMVACRLTNLTAGLLMIPLLLHYVRGEEFAAWALYVAIGLAFSMFEAAASNTLIRFAAAPAQSAYADGISRVVTNISAILFCAYVVFAPLVVMGAESFARLIRLPDGVFLAPSELIVLIFVAAMLRSQLMLGQIVLLSAGNMRWFSISSVVFSIAGNVAAVVAAAFFLRADAIVIATWAVQLVLLAGYSFVSWRRHHWGLHAAAIDSRFIRELLTHGLQLQLKEWGYFINYHFGKFLISALTGLWAVGYYEVAKRAVLALRSVPASGLELLLPVASGARERKDVPIALYRETTRFAAFGALLFIGVPLAAGWYFMYAWAGEIGYYARWAFPALGVGALVAVTAIPAALLLQAEGRPDVEARAAGISVLLNLPVSVLVIPRFGAAGAAVAIGASTAIGAIWLLVRFHRMHSLSVAETIDDLWRATRVCALTVFGVGIVTTTSFKLWLTPQLPSIGFSASARVLPAAIACGVGVVTGGFVLWAARRETWPSALGLRPSEEEVPGGVG